MSVPLKMSSYPLDIPPSPTSSRFPFLGNLWSVFCPYILSCIFQNTIQIKLYKTYSLLFRSGELTSFTQQFEYYPQCCVYQQCYYFVYPFTCQWTFVLFPHLSYLFLFMRESEREGVRRRVEGGRRGGGEIGKGRWRGRGRQRGRGSKGGREKEKERAEGKRKRILSSLHAQCGAQCESQYHDPGIMTQPEIKKSTN